MLAIVCFLKNCYIFRCSYIILRACLIMHTKVTELIKWKHFYNHLYQCFHYFNFVTSVYLIIRFPEDDL
jgi:hypothetical protein